MNPAGTSPRPRKPAGDSEGFAYITERIDGGTASVSIVDDTAKSRSISKRSDEQELGASHQSASKQVDQKPLSKVTKTKKESKTSRKKSKKSKSKKASATSAKKEDEHSTPPRDNKDKSEATETSETEEHLVQFWVPSKTPKTKKKRRNSTPTGASAPSLFESEQQNEQHLQEGESGERPQRRNSIHSMSTHTANNQEKEKDTESKKPATSIASVPVEKKDTKEEEEQLGEQAFKPTAADAKLEAFLAALREKRKSMGSDPKEHNSFQEQEEEEEAVQESPTPKYVTVNEGPQQISDHTEGEFKGSSHVSVGSIGSGSLKRSSRRRHLRVTSPLYSDDSAEAVAEAGDRAERESRKEKRNSPRQREEEQEEVAEEMSVEPEPQRHMYQQVDYYRQPTLLSRLIQFQRYESAVVRLEDYPKEASTWLVGKRQRENGEEISVEQLPLHMACQQLALSSSASGGSSQTQILQELLTQLMMVYPQGCRFPDHTGHYPIHYMIQYHAPPEMVSMALMSHPKSAATSDPLGRTLSELFNAYKVLNQDALHSSFELGASYRTLNRQEDQIAQLLEYDAYFWEQAWEESLAMRQVQESWKSQKNLMQFEDDVENTPQEEKEGSEDSADNSVDAFRTPWSLVEEKQADTESYVPEDTERTEDETSFHESFYEEDPVYQPENETSRATQAANRSASQLDANAPEYEGISTMSWELLEQRALILEQLVLQSNERNYELQQRLKAANTKQNEKEQMTTQLVESGMQMTELARQAFELRKENESLKLELRSVKMRLENLTQGRSGSVEYSPIRATTGSTSAYATSVTAVTSTASSWNALDKSVSEDEDILSIGDNEVEEKREILPERMEKFQDVTSLPDFSGDKVPSSPTRSKLSQLSSKKSTDKRKKKLEGDRSKSRRSKTSQKKNHPVSKPKKPSTPTKGEIQQREANRLMHQEYHALVQKYHAQEEVVNRLESAVDTLLEMVPAERGETDQVRKKKLSLVEQSRERRKALSWLPSGVFVPETDNLESILKHVSDQEKEIRNGQKRAHLRRMRILQENPPSSPKRRTKSLHNRRPIDFHFDISLPYLSKGNSSELLEVPKAEEIGSNNYKLEDDSILPARSPTHRPIKDISIPAEVVNV